MPYSPDLPTNIIAVIPYEDDPNLHLVDADGEYPSIPHQPGETYEGTFRRIGVEKLGQGSLSVARRLASLEGPNDIIYRAKPISYAPAPESGLFWKAR